MTLSSHYLQATIGSPPEEVVSLEACLPLILLEEFATTQDQDDWEIFKDAASQSCPTTVSIDESSSSLSSLDSTSHIEADSCLIPDIPISICHSHFKKETQVGSLVSTSIGCWEDPEHIAIPSNIADLFETSRFNGFVSNQLDFLPDPARTLQQVFDKYSQYNLYRQNSVIRFRGKRPHWILYRLPTNGCFQAQFQAHNLAPVIMGRKHDLQQPLWIRKRKGNQARPRTLADVLKCIPVSWRAQVQASAQQHAHWGVYFASIDLAIRVEAAIWLEGQFRMGARHWYETPIHDMVQMLCQEMEERRCKKEKRQKTIS